MESEDLATLESPAVQSGLDSDVCSILLRGDDAVGSCSFLPRDDAVVVEPWRHLS